MKVLIIAQQTVSMVSGGPDVQARRTAAELRGLGVETEFFDPWKRYDLKSFDLAHVFSAGISTYDIAARLRHFGLRFAVSPIFFTLRSPRVIRTALRLESALGRFISGVRTDYSVGAHVCRLADLVLPNTHAEARLITEGFGLPPERVIVVPNGVDERFINATPDLFVQKYGLRDFILNVGHIGSPRKNVLSLLRAARELNRPVVLIGKVHQGDYARACLRQATENGNVLVIEGLPNDSPMLESAYAACGVFALPSWFETPGIAALEAALAGAPIVVTKYGGTEDYFADMAQYVNPFKTHHIARGIGTALAAPRTDVLRQRIAAKFLWRSVAQQTAEAYQRILSQ